MSAESSSPTEGKVEIPPQLTRWVGEGERVLWIGFPDRSLLFRTRELPLVRAGVLLSLASGAASLFLCFRGGGVTVGLGFLVLGAYLAVGHFYRARSHRRRTTYAITDRRVLIVVVGVKPVEFSIALRNVEVESLEQERGELWNLVFGSRPGFYAKDEASSQVAWPWGSPPINREFVGLKKAEASVARRVLLSAASDELPAHRRDIGLRQPQR